ncbi:DUF2770 family protein [Budviciaceae bacterium CWB-B4]|uniref:DUF2770 family protein n=1 Tax=Limnobaculum xujianqingii TaxID=2738837 RepID=A0A9D7AHW5_9GAMM|nr:DUF2770 family protein [Limnobaculum xujianqingii]MBK5176265.1 DUF2770 family protein [Limnobaculum xujianqingii]
MSRIIDTVMNNIREHMMIYIVIWIIVLLLDIYYIWFYE